MSDKVRGGRGVDDRDVVAKTLRKGAREADRRAAVFAAGNFHFAAGNDVQPA